MPKKILGPFARDLAHLKDFWREVFSSGLHVDFPVERKEGDPHVGCYSTKFLQDLNRVTNFKKLLLVYVERSNL